jgi:hypothetical protein
MAGLQSALAIIFEWSQTALADQFAFSESRSSR